MYIAINDIIGEKRIDLSYPIHSVEERLGAHRVEIPIVSMFSNNVQYWLKGHLKVQLKSGEEIMLNKAVYMDKELNELTGLELKSQMIDS